MSSMMGRFNLGGSKQASVNIHTTSPQPQSSQEFGSSTTSNILNSTSNLMSSKPSMSSLTMSSMNISSITKKMTSGLNIANLTGMDPDRKSKLEAEEKKTQIAMALSVLEDVRLQCPQTHTGLVLAYTGTTLAPIINPGIKFTWFRMSGEDRIDQVEESLKAWYPPTVDDIGSIICAQCEDNFDQNCSRYVECGPIKADALLCSLAESTIENGIFEAKEICVSLGLQQQESVVEDYNTIVQNNLNNESNNLLRNLTTVLSQDSSFLQLNGHSTIEVDESGIFISIPTFKQASSASTKTSSAMKTSRRGLRIPASTGLRVVCAQPLSLIVVVPIKYKGVPSFGQSDDGSNESDSDNNERRESKDAVSELPVLSRQASNDKSESPLRGRTLSVDSITSASSPGKKAAHDNEEQMKKFLSSSIVAIPWTYEGHNHSPEAYATEGDSKLSPEEKEAVLQSAEEDAIIFANTVCALAEFISSLPEGTEELQLCFSCTDRLVRDALVLSIRSLAAQPSGCPLYERRRVFPWISLSEDGSNAQVDNENSNSGLIGESSESDQDVKRRLRTIEEENATLKRERNELTNQLLQSREELLVIKHQNKGGQHGGASSDDAPMMGVTTVNFNSHGVSESTPLSSESDTFEGDRSGDTFKQLSSKVIELENKLAIVSKRESEATKIRSDLESKNNRLTQDFEKYKKSSDEATRKLAALQSMYDRQLQNVTRLEDEQVVTKADIDKYIVRLKELDKLRAVIAEKDAELVTQRQLLDESKNQLKEQQSQSVTLMDQIIFLKAEAVSKAKEHASLVTHLEEQLSASVMESKRHEREIFTLGERIKTMEADIELSKQLRADLKEAEGRADRLSGEMNSLLRKSDSQAQDLKKVLRENAVSLAEFEKALIRKSEECNDLYFKINELKDAEAARQNESSSSSSNLFNKLSSLRRDSVSGPGSSHDERGETTSNKDTDNNSTTTSSSSNVSATLSGYFRRASGAV